LNAALIACVGLGLVTSIVLPTPTPASEAVGGSTVLVILAVLIGLWFSHDRYISPRAAYATGACAGLVFGILAFVEAVTARAGPAVGVALGVAASLVAGAALTSWLMWWHSERGREQMRALRQTARPSKRLQMVVVFGIVIVLGAVTGILFSDAISRLIGMP